jgi:hypothetical protein
MSCEISLPQAVGEYIKTHGWESTYNEKTKIFTIKGLFLTQILNKSRSKTSLVSLDVYRDEDYLGYFVDVHISNKVTKSEDHHEQQEFTTNVINDFVSQYNIGDHTTSNQLVIDHLADLLKLLKFFDREIPTLID